MSVREIALDEVRADAWLERVGDGSASFLQLIGIVGERYFAYSLIVGVQITSIAVDRRHFDGSTVRFVLGEDETEHTMQLGELKRRVTLALMEEEDARPTLSASPTSMDVHLFLGPRLVLLAGLDGVKLLALLVSDEGGASLRCEIEGEVLEMPVEDLEARLLERVREDAVALTNAAQPTFDLSRVAEAERLAEAGEWERTIELLGPWAGPLSMITRSIEAQRLGPDVRGQLARALGLLGTAYAKQKDFEQGETVLRLGIQWGQDGPVAADLFHRLGCSALERDEAGEAIGYLRRALALGHSRSTILPRLAEAFASRGRYVAAMACVDEACALGVRDDSLEETRARCALVVGDAWANFRRYVPLPSTSSETIRPPGREG